MYVGGRIKEFTNTLLSFLAGVRKRERGRGGKRERGREEVVPLRQLPLVQCTLSNSLNYLPPVQY